MSATGALGAVVLALFVGLGQFGLHKIPEGAVGVYYRGGAILPQTTEPGYHVMMPFVTRMQPMQVNIQTDLVRDIPCGTQGGTVIHFEKIEVVNRLRRENVLETVKEFGVNYDKTWIYDKIHHEINQFCSKHDLTEVYITEFDTVDEKLTNALQEDCDKWNTGIEILSIRVTKPRIPEAIQLNFEQMESEKTRLRVAEQTQKVVVKEAETQKSKAIVEAQKAAEISVINMEKRLAEKRKYAEMESIADEMTVNRMKANADASYYSKRQAAEGNQARLSPRFLQEQLLRRMANTTKQYYGRTLTDVLTALDLDQMRAGLTTPPTAQAAAAAEGSPASDGNEE